MPPNAPVLALELLYDAVVARFLVEGPNVNTPPFHADVAQPFGWRNPAQQHVGPRIVWIPGNPVGTAGTITAPRNPGRVPRSLATLQEFFYVIISSQDPTDPENERLQYRSTRLLHDYWLRAVYHAARGTYAFTAEEWNTSKLERRYGTAIVVVGSIESMIPDVGPDGTDGTAAAPIDTGAVIDVHELDLTETIVVAPNDVP